MRRFEYLKPESAEMAANLCGQGATLGLAGGVDLVDRMKEGLDRPARVVALKPVLEDRVAPWAGRGPLRIGAGITLAELSRDPVIREMAPNLAHAAGEAATPQVREMATLGGNLMQRSRCWYYRSRHYDCLKTGGEICWAQDGRNENHALFGNSRCASVNPSNTAPALLCLGAELEILGPDGSRRMPLAGLFVSSDEDPQREQVLGQDELITAVVLPRAALGPRAAHYEVRHKQSYDWPLAMADASFNGPAPRLVLGAVASIPIDLSDSLERRTRIRELEQAVQSEHPVPRGVLEEIADVAVTRATPLAGNRWRLPLVKAAVKRALLKALGVPEEQW